jgi:hypothetical protein
MATQLNPGADQTLVAAAYRASMANVPLDHSKAYAALAEGYGKFAEGMVAMYAPIAKGVGEAVKPLVDKVKEKVGDNLEELWLNINKPFKDDWTVQPNERGEQITSLVEEWEASTGEGGLHETVYDKRYATFNSDHIKELQTKIELLYPNALPKWGADGRMGLETETAIKNLLKEKEELSKSSVTIEPDGVYSFVNTKGQTSNISLVGQDKYIRQLKDEERKINTLYKNGEITLAQKDKDLGNIRLKVENAERSIGAFSKEQVRVMNLINEGNFNPMASGAMNMEFINAAIERGRTAPDGSRVVRGFDDDGNIALIWIDKYGRAKTDPTTGKSWVVSQGEMKKFIVEKDAASEVSITKHVTTDQQKLGASGLKFNGQEVANNITKICSNETTFLDMINTSLADNTGTFREHVYGAKKDQDGNWTLDPTKLGEDMYAQLNMLGGKFDADRDGDVDAQDFATDENKAALAHYLTSYNPTSVNAFANFMKNTAERYHNQGSGTIKGKGTGTGTGTGTKTATWTDPFAKGYGTNYKSKEVVEGNPFTYSQLATLHYKFHQGSVNDSNGVAWTRQDDGSWMAGEGGETISGKQLVEKMANETGVTDMTSMMEFEPYRTDIGASESVAAGATSANLSNLSKNNYRAINRLKDKGAFGVASSKILLNYGSNLFADGARNVIGIYNKEYRDYGFEAYEVNLGAGRGNALDIIFTPDPSHPDITYVYSDRKGALTKNQEYDNQSFTRDLQTTGYIVTWMKKMVKEEQEREALIKAGENVDLSEMNNPN